MLGKVIQQLSRSAANGSRQNSLGGMPIAGTSRRSSGVSAAASDRAQARTASVGTEDYRLLTQFLDTPARPSAQDYLACEVDAKGRTRLAYRDEGWSFWEWEGHNIHYLDTATEGPVVVLVHGFGASAYHWRYQVPQLSQHFRVLAIDMLGFGWSDKAPVDYCLGYGEASTWVRQLRDFIQAKAPGQKVFLAGNSLGGYVSLATGAYVPHLVAGVALLNGAGQFETPNSAANGATTATNIVSEGLVKELATESMEEAGKAAVMESTAAATVASSNASSMWFKPLVDTAMANFARTSLYFSFLVTKHPWRVKQVLKMVYVNHDVLDDDLVRSILKPADDPQAADVFHRVLMSGKQGASMNELLGRLEVPLHLVWGQQDPWCTAARADRIQQMHPTTTAVRIEGSGHCPHDDTPEAVNKALVEWVHSLCSRGATGPAAA